MNWVSGARDPWFATPPFHRALAAQTGEPRAPHFDRHSADGAGGSNASPHPNRAPCPARFRPHCCSPAGRKVSRPIRSARDSCLRASEVWLPAPSKQRDSVPGLFTLHRELFGEDDLRALFALAHMLSRQALAMKKQTDPDLTGKLDFRSNLKFAGEATEGQVAAKQESFKRQAELFRRNGDDGRAAFWQALSNRRSFAESKASRCWTSIRMFRSMACAAQR